MVEAIHLSIIGFASIREVRTWRVSTTDKKSSYASLFLSEIPCQNGDSILNHYKTSENNIALPINPVKGIYPCLWLFYHTRNEFHGFYTSDFLVISCVSESSLIIEWFQSMFLFDYSKLLGEDSISLLFSA